MAIVMTKEVCGGSPRIDGRRITVCNILGYLAGEMTIEEICEDFELTKEEVIEAIEWAADYIEKQCQLPHPIEGEAYKSSS